MRGSLLSTLAASLLLSASNVSADGRVEFNRFTVPVVGEPIADCGSFQILNDYVLHFENKLVDGDWVFNHWHQQQSIIYSSADPSFFVRTGDLEQNNNHVGLPLPDGSFDFRATLHWVIVLPGGPVCQETGLFVANSNGILYRSTGLNDLVNGDWPCAPVLCEYFAAHDR